MTLISDVELDILKHCLLSTKSEAFKNWNPNGKDRQTDATERITNPHSRGNKAV